MHCTSISECSSNTKVRFVRQMIPLYQSITLTEKFLRSNYYNQLIYFSLQFLLFAILNAIAMAV